jgi:predicted alpha/beta-hydrolase family hydrolase
VSVAWIEDGDHDLKPRKKSGRTHEQNLTEAIDTAARFIASL